jgi:carbonic anhydrase/acetyltransferase-like protein (isoleucine patch superfamily)
VSQAEDGEGAHMALVKGFAGRSPRFEAGVYLAETATVIGDVALGEDSSVWFGSVLRGDVGSIRIGARTNIQDLAMVHMSHEISNAEIGDDVTVGHSAIIHGARVGNGCLIGMGSILLDNSEVGDEALVGAGSLLSVGFRVPPRTLAMGRPAKIVRPLTPEEWRQGRVLAERYVELARVHQKL